MSFLIGADFFDNIEDSSEVGASFAALKMRIDDVNVLAYRATHEEDGNHLEIPLYYIAEWIAENWWALLWEPYKSEERIHDDTDYLSRHSFLAAEHGFYLPNIQLSSSGRMISITATPRSPPHSDLKFVNAARTNLDKSKVQAILSEFIELVALRLKNKGFNATHLQECWEAVKNTPPEATPYCELMGALGLSPYEINENIDSILDELSETIGDAYLRDLCLVARPEDIFKASRAAKIAVSVVNTAPELDFSDIVKIPVPKDAVSTPAWQRGRHAANVLRNRLAISDIDEDGVDRIFELISFDAKRRASIGDSDFQSDGAAIVGAVRRSDKMAQIGCIQKNEPQRRFTAARGIFTAWSSKAMSGNLLTQAVTRQQQASRAFAAELLAPLEYIRGWSTNQTLSHSAVIEISKKLRVGIDVVEKQAENHGLVLQKSY